VTSAPSAPVADSFAVLPAHAPPDLATGATCSGSIGAADAVAIVHLQGAADEDGPVVLRDYADPTAPRTSCTFTSASWSLVELVDARHLVVAAPEDGGLFAVVDLPELRYHWFRLPESPSGYESQLITVAPTLDRVVWISSDPEVTESDAIHVTTAAADRVVATVRDTNTGSCGGPVPVGRFTRSGLAYVLDQPMQGEESLVVIDGDKIAFSLVAPKAGWTDANRPSMAVWSPAADTLYYSRGADAWRWTAGGGATKFLPGVTWHDPTISPNGTHLAYSVVRADGAPAVYLVDLANGGSPKRLGTGPRDLPAFLSDSQLWYLALADQGGCAGGSEKPLIYNLRDGSEAPSIIVDIRATWPATSSNW